MGEVHVQGIHIEYFENPYSLPLMRVLTHTHTHTHTLAHTLAALADTSTHMHSAQAY